MSDNYISVGGQHHAIVTATGKDSVMLNATSDLGLVQAFCEFVRNNKDNEKIIAEFNLDFFSFSYRVEYYGQFNTITIHPYFGNNATFYAGMICDDYTQSIDGLHPYTEYFISMLKDNK